MNKETQVNAIEAQRRCQSAEHNYGIVMFGEGPMLETADGTRIVLFVCSKCGDEHIVNLTALGLPQIKRR